MDHKNKDISESMNSFRSGAIFLSSLGQELSRNTFVVRIAFPERNSYCRKDFCMHQKNENFHEIFEKVVSPSDLLILGGPAGGSEP